MTAPTNELLPELKACPFCGGDVSCGGEWLQGERTCAYYYCTSCHASPRMPRVDNKEEAAKVWNTRSPQPSAGVQEVEVSDLEIADIVSCARSKWVQNTQDLRDEADVVIEALRAKFSITPKREG